MKNNEPQYKQVKSMQIEKSIHEKLTKVAFENQMRIQPFLEKVLGRVLSDKALIKEIVQ